LLKVKEPDAARNAGNSKGPNIPVSCPAHSRHENAALFVEFRKGRSKKVKIVNLTIFWNMFKC
jgi:hypothetical protein